MQDFRSCQQVHCKVKLNFGNRVPFDDLSGEIFVLLYEFDFEISMLSLLTLIGLPLDIISKYVNIFSKPVEPKVSSA